jgi:peptide-methionine (R)-S-oxide reductase
MLVALLGLCACGGSNLRPAEPAAPGTPPAASTLIPPHADGASTMSERIVRTDEEWRKILTPEQFEVTRHRGTERACSGAYWEHHDAGTYSCVCCGLDLFSSDAKFDSGTGWPSFFQPVAKENVIEVEDRSYGMVRTEILCAKCDAHLGHVFEDGPRPTGLRFCLNSLSLEFSPAPGSPK